MKTPARSLPREWRHATGEAATEKRDRTEGTDDREKGKSKSACAYEYLRRREKHSALLDGP